MQQISVLEKFVNLRTGGAYLDGRPSNPNMLVGARKSVGGGGGGGQEDIRMMIMNMKDGGVTQTTV